MGKSITSGDNVSSGEIEFVDDNGDGALDVLSSTLVSDPIGHTLNLAVPVGQIEFDTGIAQNDPDWPYSSLGDMGLVVLAVIAAGTFLVNLQRIFNALKWCGGKLHSLHRCFRHKKPKTFRDPIGTGRAGKAVGDFLRENSSTTTEESENDEPPISEDPSSPTLTIPQDLGDSEQRILVAIRRSATESRPGIAMFFAGSQVFTSDSGSGRVKFSFNDYDHIRAFESLLDAGYIWEANPYTDRDAMALTPKGEKLADVLVDSVDLSAWEIRPSDPPRAV